MAQPLRREVRVDVPDTGARIAVRARGPAYEAYLLLYAAFIAAPLIAGVDKFFDALGPWHNYLAPVIAQWLPVAPQTFLMGVGVIEVLAALVVAARPRIGGYVVAVWLGAIIVNLLLARAFYDVALRDFGLMLGALALARLARQFERPGL
jgi:hypothetical protein